MKTLTLALLLFAAGPDKDPVVISAGAVVIRQSELEKALSTLPETYQGHARGAGKRQFAEDYLRMKLLAASGLKAGLDKDPAVLEELALMRDNLVANAQLKKMEEGIVIPEKDLLKKYEASKSQYEEVQARHILVAFKGSPAAQAGKPELTEDQARAKAESLRKKIVSGSSFEALAQSESDDVGSGSAGGDLGSFGRGQMVPEFEKAAFETKVGEISTVVRSQYGYHVIRVDKHSFTPFQEVKSVLERNERQERLQTALQKMNDDAKPSYDATYFGAN